MDDHYLLNVSRLKLRRSCSVQPPGILEAESAFSESLGGGFKYFLFLPLPGEMIQFDEHIFQMGGSTTN